MTQGENDWEHDSVCRINKFAVDIMLIVLGAVMAVCDGLFLPDMGAIAQDEV